MKTELAVGLVLCVAAFQQASAQSIGSNPTGPYLGGALGFQYFEDDDAADVDAGGSISAQFGYRFSDNIRTELEAEVIGAEVDNSDDTLALGRATLGLYYDLRSSDHLLVPYFGAGLGIAGVAIDDDEGDDEDLKSEFTWHGEAGVSLNLNSSFAIVPSYRYTWVDDSKDVTADPVTSHAFRVGLRLSF